MHILVSSTFTAQLWSMCEPGLQTVTDWWCLSVSCISQSVPYPANRTISVLRCIIHVWCFRVQDGFRMAGCSLHICSLHPLRVLVLDMVASYMLALQMLSPYMLHACLTASC